jgi:hypothetical protein
VGFKEIGYEGMNWYNLVLSPVQWLALVNTVMTFWFLLHLSDYNFVKKVCSVGLFLNVLLEVHFLELKPNTKEQTA